MRSHPLGDFAIRHRLAIAFVTAALCVGGGYAAFRMPSALFPQTDFPRVVILADNGLMEADEMMATVTRPIEEAMKGIPGSVSVRSSTGRGSAEISVFFDWQVDMVQSELYVGNRLAEIRVGLPATVHTTVWRMTFAAFPILGLSLTSADRSLTDLWEIARYEIKPRLLRIRGVARVDLVGGRAPEYHIVVDPIRLQAANLSLQEVSDALTKSNFIVPTGMHEENYMLYLTVVDGRLHSIEEIMDLPVAVAHSHPILVRDFATVERGPEPMFNAVTADGLPAVLLNIRSQPDGSTLDIARDVQRVLFELKKDLPPDLRTAYYYDQSTFVRESVAGAREAIEFGLILSLLIIYLFLKDWRITLTAIAVIPVTVLITFAAMRAARLTFNVMTLGGIAAAIGLVIDDAIVVVEAIHAKLETGATRLVAIPTAIGEIIRPLVGSTLTPVVVFIPLTFLDGIAGVFFRALALTMVVALLTSLVLAVLLTPSVAAWLIRDRPTSGPGLRGKSAEGGALLRRALRAYEIAVRAALRHHWTTLGACGLILLLGVALYGQLESEFLPPLDEGGFIIDYITPFGTSLAETQRQLLQAEEILRTTPEVESYSRRTGARLALAIAEPNTGDFLVKLRSDRARKTDEVIADLRQQFQAALPAIEWEFPGILGDLIGDLTWSPQPIEVKLFSNDIEFLKRKAPEVADEVRKVKGVVDVLDGLIYAGPSIPLRVRQADVRRFGLTAADVAATVNAAMLGETATSVLDGDRVIAIRVLVDRANIDRLATLRELPLRTPEGGVVKLSQVVDLVEAPGQLELRREDLRQDVAITARLEGRDLGSAMAEIRELLTEDETLPTGTVEFGGLYEQQQESFRNLMVVLAMAIFLVFTVLLIEFRSFSEPVAIVVGAALSLFGTVLALWITGTSLDVVSLLGAIIGLGIVAKNGILMLDFVEHLRAAGSSLEDALVGSGRRRLRPVLMTSMAAAFGMLPLAYGVGSGADMLRPLAIAVIGALLISVLLSLVATPTLYYAILRAGRSNTADRAVH